MSLFVNNIFLLKCKKIKNLLRIVSWKYVNTNYFSSKPQVCPIKKRIDFHRLLSSGDGGVVTARSKTNELETNFYIIRPWNDDFRHIMFAYIDACIHIDKLDEAQKVILAYSPEQLNFKTIDNQHLDSKLYTHLMHAWAKHHKYNQIEELQAAMESIHIKVVPQVFAAKLECLARTNFDDKKLGLLLQEIKDKGLNLEDIFSKCIFKMDEKSKILQTIHKYNPNFILESHESSTYSCKLMEHLNRKVIKDIPSFEKETSLLTIEELKYLGEKQLRNELQGFQDMKSIEKLPDLDEKTKQTREKWEYFLKSCHPILLKFFLVEREHLEKSLTDTSCVSIAPFLRLLPPEDFVRLLLQEMTFLLRSSKHDRVPIVPMFEALGHHVYILYQTYSRARRGGVDKISQLYNKYLEYYIDPKLSSEYLPREYWNLLTKECGQDFILNHEDAVWTEVIERRIGKFLFNIIIKNIEVDANLFKKTTDVHMVPAFYQIFKDRFSFCLRPHPLLIKFLARGMEDNLYIPSNQIPMLVPPIPWINTRNGGYFLSSAKIMRDLEVASNCQNILDEMSPQQYQGYLDTVNMFGSFPWTINKSILDVMITMFRDNSGEKLGLPIHPQLQFHYNLEKQKLYDSRIHFKISMKKIIYNQYNEWNRLRHKLSLANMICDKVFWLPHKMDFRGRIYTTYTSLSFTGSDIDRGLLKFANGRMLGDKGLDWLKINLVNLTGHKKKLSLEERLTYANEMISEIIDSADKPFDGNRWWTKADKPWQVLACCIEITRAIRSINPSEYLAQIPVLQDGTTNMLQHYAALTRDQNIAKLVNLEPMDTQQDFYAEVVESIQKAIDEDSEKGFHLAKTVRPLVQRKIIKGLVIAAVYGAKEADGHATLLPLLEQISCFPHRELWGISIYLARKINYSVRKNFPDIFRVQKWLRTCAYEIARQRKIPVQWETPLGLLVFQPYYRVKVYKSKNLIEKNEFSEDDLDEEEIELHQKDELMKKIEKKKQNKVTNVDQKKQINSFSANYIHCLDACHMILTAWSCQRQNIPFLAVHDSFLSYPDTVDIMNNICREQFVALHQEPLLENLSNYMLKNFAYTKSDIVDDCSIEYIKRNQMNQTLIDIPKKGSFDLQQVLRSTYFFS